MTPRLTASRQRAVPALVAMGALMLLLTAGALGLALLLARPPDGPPLAVQDIPSGQPFELELVSNGKSLRFWLDMQCDNCAFPVEGAMTVSAQGKELARAEISAGDSDDRAWGGHSRSLQQHLVFDAPAAAAGEKLTVKGTLAPLAPRGLTGAPVKGAPGPEMRLFRLSVTN